MEVNMDTIRKKWKIIAFIYLIIIYILVITIFKNTIHTLITYYICFFAITTILFLGTTIGLIGVFLHNITKKSSIAMPFYKLSYKLKTKNVNVLAGYGLSLLKINQPDKSKDVFEEALLHTNFFLTIKSIRANIAMCYWKLNDIDTAICEYEKLLTEYGSNKIITDKLNVDEIINNNPYMFAMDFTTLGYLYILKNDLERARLYTDVALSQSDKFPPALDNLGQIYYRKKDYSNAKKYFKMAIEESPYMVDSNYYLALIYKYEGNIKRAKELLNVASSCTIDGLSTVTLEDINNELN
jgi:Tfp pilus assembly protein PilF